MAEKNRIVSVLLGILLIFCILNFGLCIWLVKMNIHPRPPELAGPDLIPPMPPSSMMMPPEDNKLGKQGPKDMHRGHDARGRGMGRRRFQSSNIDMNSPEVRGVFELLAEYYPEWHEMLEQAKQPGRRNNRELRRKLWKYWPKIVKLVDTYKYDPELARKLIEDSYLRNRADALAREYHQSDDPAEKERIKRELTEILSRQFEVRQWIRERKLSNLEKRINQLRTELQQRLEKRDELIRHQLKLRIEQEVQEQSW